MEGMVGREREAPGDFLKTIYFAGTKMQVTKCLHKEIFKNSKEMHRKLQKTQ